MSWIDKTAVIGPGVEIGNDVIIGPYCVIGYPAEHPRIPYQFRGKVIIGDNCVLTKSITVDCPMTEGEYTVIGNGSHLYAQAHVGHDCKIGKNVVIAGAKIGGHSIIEDYCNIGLGAVTHQFTRLAPGIMLGAGSFIKGTHVRSYRIFAGSPARDIGLNKVLLERLIQDGTIPAQDLSDYSDLFEG
jgi:UDP-N-acetylglucosamine acyltransferase